jgi:hypothetical protein
MRFNFIKTKASTKGANALNLAGGEAFTETARLELASLLLTSTLQDQFYRKADASVDRIKALVASIPDKAFIAKAAIYARREAGMRSVSHLVAAELAKSVKGADWSTRFFTKIVRRADDVLEILACYMAQYGRPIPNSLKRGLGRALSGFDDYQVAKYRKTTADLSLVDAVNLLHPPHSESLGKLVRGTLLAAETWETKLTQAGACASTEDEKSTLKAAAWTSLIRERKIGYFALLRNLRNILETAPELKAAVIQLLTDEKLVRKSLVLPFRFSTTLEALQGAALAGSGDVLAALSDAVDLSLANVPKFDGKTLIALDCSGSMCGKPLKIGSLFAATLVKSNAAELMLFSDDAFYLPVNRRDSTLSLAQFIEGKATPAGTNFHSIFQRATQAYDRIIILSDMQGWMGHYTPAKSFAEWKTRCGADPKVFSFDLAGYGSLQFPESKVCCLAGFSDQTMQMLHELDSDPRALIRRIEAVEL